MIQMRIPVDTTIPMSICFASHAATYTYVQCIYGSCHQKTHRSDKQLAHRKTPGIPHYYLGHVHHAACRQCELVLRVVFLMSSDATCDKNGTLIRDFNAQGAAYAGGDADLQCQRLDSHPLAPSRRPSFSSSCSTL